MLVQNKRYTDIEINNKKYKTGILKFFPSCRELGEKIEGETANQTDMIMILLSNTTLRLA